MKGYQNKVANRNAGHTERRRSALSQRVNVGGAIQRGRMEPGTLQGEIMQLQRMIGNRAVIQLLRLAPVTPIGTNVIQRTNVKVTLTSDEKYEGKNKNDAAVKDNLDTSEFTVPSFKKVFEKNVDKEEGYDIWHCAEPHALSLLVKSVKDTKSDFKFSLLKSKLSNAKMGQAKDTDTDENIDKCKNCRQWLKGKPDQINTGIIPELFAFTTKKVKRPKKKTI